MANKLKLVFLNKNLAATKDWLQALSTGLPAWTSPTNEFYRSLVFTQDGHLLTHGIDFNPVASLGAGLLFNPTAGVTNVSAPESGTDGAIPIFENQTGQWSVNWIETVDFVMYPEHGFTSGQVLIGNGTSTPNTRAIVTSGVSDNSGLITKNAVDAAIENFIPYPTWTSGDTNKYVLIQTAAKNVTKYKLLDSIATADATSLLTGLAVKNAIADAFAANDAMVFKGILDSTHSLPSTGYQAGWTYRVAVAGTYAGAECEVGDLVIAVKDYATGASNSDWTVVLTNIDGALTTANLGGTTDELLRAVSLVNNKLVVNLILRGINVKNQLLLSDTDYGTVNFSANNSLSVSTQLNNDSNTIIYGIDNNITAQGTQGLYKIKHNALGLITGSTAWNPASLTLDNIVSNWSSSAGGGSAEYNPDQSSILLYATRGLVFLQTPGDSIINIGHVLNGATTVTSLTGVYISGLVIDPYGHVIGVETAQDINTWRPVNAYLLLANGSKLTTLLSTTPSSVGTADLTFGSEFVFAGTETIGSESGNEIHLVWAEVDSNGNITYAV